MYVYGFGLPMVRFQPIATLSQVRCVRTVSRRLGVCLLSSSCPDIDRYIYEAIVRGKSQPLEVVYDTVKHENPRAEESSVLDSPQHLRELEPLYAIRPLYLETISLLGTRLPIQNAIDLISAASLFGIGVVVVCWTRKPILSVLLIAAYPVLILGRLGTPDALSTLLVITGLWLIEREHSHLLGVSILFVSLGVRTDNVLLVLGVLGWLAWNKKMKVYLAGLLAILAAAAVLGINHWAGSYGWIVCSDLASPEAAIPPNFLTSLRCDNTLLLCSGELL